MPLSVPSSLLWLPKAGMLSLVAIGDGEILGEFANLETFKTRLASRTSFLVIDLPLAELGFVGE